MTTPQLSRRSFVGTTKAERAKHGVRYLYKNKESGRFITIEKYRSLPETPSAPKQSTKKKLTIGEKTLLTRVNPKKQSGKTPYKSAYFVDEKGNAYSSKQAKAISEGKLSYRAATLKNLKLTEKPLSDQSRVKGFQVKVPANISDAELHNILENEMVTDDNYMYASELGRLHKGVSGGSSIEAQWRAVPTAAPDAYRNEKYVAYMRTQFGEMFIPGSEEEITLTFFKPSQRGE